MQTPKTYSGAEEEVLPASPGLTAQSMETLHLNEVLGRALRATGHASLGSIEVTVNERLVILKGRVTSYYLKQLAQATALALPGIERVCNDLEVGRRS